VCLDEDYAEAEALRRMKERDGVALLNLLNGYIGYLRSRKDAEANVPPDDGWQ